MDEATIAAEAPKRRGRPPKVRELEVPPFEAPEPTFNPLPRHRLSYWGIPVAEIRLRRDERLFVAPGLMLGDGDIIRTDNGKALALETHPLGCLGKFKLREKVHSVIIPLSCLGCMVLAE